jgi:4-hydroxybenzoate polyprenyltransferase
MSAAATRNAVPFGTLLRLGRVSNLPTVWTNVLAATAIAGGDPASARTASVAFAMTLFYVGGMYLNDAFDRDIDARERPGRPIPAGEISAAAVFGLGFTLLALGCAIMALHGLASALVGLTLAGAVVVYDVHHKGNALSPVLMGLCRALVYVGAAMVAAGAIPTLVLIAAAGVFAHVVGLTYAAKQETLDKVERLWPLAVLALPLVVALPWMAAGWTVVAAWLALAAVDLASVRLLKERRAPGAVPRAVATLIAGISLVDAVFVASVAPWLALPCWAGFILTRALQRVVPGT